MTRELSLKVRSLSKPLVFVADCSLTNKKYAVKMICKSKMRNPGFRKCIERELAILPKLHHRNIVQFEAKFEDEEYLYIVMEY